MAVFRIDKTRDYTVMANHHLRNKALSLKAKGLLSLMLSLPEDWDYTTKGLSMICKDGVDSICLAMSAQAITQRSAVMRKTQSDNELYTFRVWLVRLGLNGDEFKNTRDHLLANLEGDRAWRYEKESYERNQKKKASGERER